MACSTSAWAIFGESKAEINWVVKPTQSSVMSSNYVPSQVYTKLQREDSLTSCFLLSLTISRMRLWRLEDFWRIYATWRTTRSCWAFVVFTSTNFLEGVEIAAKGVRFLSSLISGTPAWVPTKVVEVTDLDRSAESSLVGARCVGIGIGEWLASWSSWWLLPLIRALSFLNFFSMPFIVSSVAIREHSRSTLESLL